MEIRGIDVSAYQGTIDWKTVANYGMGFAILRITEKGNKTDSQFEANYSGCKAHSIPVGVYKFSYALNITDAQKEAQSVLNVLKGRTLEFPVWLDLEYAKQCQLGNFAVEKIAVAFLKTIKSAGYSVGIYCNADWYKKVLTDTLKLYDCWIAQYPSYDNGTLQERLRPSYGVGWQYSSKATIPGINTKVDRNVFYKDYKGSDNMTETEAKNKVIEIARGEIGYLEKASNKNLDSKTANAGSGNYTKYWESVKPSYQGQPWCACFVTWVFVQAFGQTAAKKLLKHYPYVYCPTMASLFTLNANPKVGDIVIFKHNGTFTHTGIVTAVNGDKFTTIEGNTSGASGIIANGGGVCQKSYYNSHLPGTKFCTPNWSIVATDGNTGSSAPSKERKFVGKVTADVLNIRKGAGTGYKNLVSYPTLNKGNLVDVCDTVKASDGSDWYYIRIAGKYFGYASAKFIQKV